MVVPLMLVASLVAIGLLLTVMIRMGRRFDELTAEQERMKVVQRDMTSDVRTRLDEGAKTWASVEGEIRPKLEHLERLEPSVADLSALLEENLPALAEARQRLEAVEQASQGTESRVTAALEAGASETDERCERIENAVRTLRNAADERLADVTARVSTLEDAVSARVTALEEAVTAPPEQVEAAREAISSVTPPPIPGGAEERRRHASRGTELAGRGRGGWLLVALVLIGGLVALVATLS
jgi:chromosome segregation ATPase